MSTTFLGKILADMGTAATAFVGNVGEWTSTISGNEMLIAFLGIAFATIGLGIILRIVRSFC